MQRVRIGLTGLACVFLLVLLAAAFFGLTNDERQTGPLVSAPDGSSAVNSAAADAPREPLAELGVAPGYATDSGAGNVVAPAAEPAPVPPPAAGGDRVPPSPPTPR